MQQIIMRENEAGQRFDKYLVKYLSAAPSGFIYKMLRKKNILLNDTKAQGREMLKKGDIVTFYLADDTLQKFTASEEQNNTDQYALAYRTFGSIPIAFENEHILIVNKPSGILSQKASDTDLSLNEWLIGYLLNDKKITKEDLCTFRPSVCNRLDRNTSGLVICGKSLLGSQKMSELLKSRNIHKFYRLFVKGTMDQEAYIEGYLQKNHKTNKVYIEKTTSVAGSKHAINTKSTTNPDKKEYIVTKYKPLKSGSEYSYLEVELITGKTHQIRAHLASIGHPLIGDFKYGNPTFNSRFKGLGINDQMLHSYRLEFPELQGEFLSISKKVIVAEEPALFKTLYEEIG